MLLRVFTRAWSSSSRRTRRSPWSRSRPRPAPPGSPPAPKRMVEMKTNAYFFFADIKENEYDLSSVQDLGLVLVKRQKGATFMLCHSVTDCDMQYAMFLDFWLCLYHMF